MHEEHDKWIKRIQKTIVDVESATNPEMQRLQTIQSELEKERTKQVKESRKWLRNQLIYFFVMIILIPILVICWNVHPVLGILGIVGYIFLIRNKFKTGYYFGF